MNMDQPPVSSSDLLKRPPSAPTSPKIIEGERKITDMYIMILTERLKTLEKNPCLPKWKSKHQLYVAAAVELAPPISTPSTRSISPEMLPSPKSSREGWNSTSTRTSVSDPDEKPPPLLRAQKRPASTLSESASGFPDERLPKRRKVNPRRSGDSVVISTDCNSHSINTRSRKIASLRRNYKHAQSYQAITPS